MTFDGSDLPPEPSPLVGAHIVAAAREIRRSLVAREIPGPAASGRAPS